MTTSNSMTSNAAADIVNPYDSGDIKGSEEPRNINELLKIPYLEMSEDEIKLVVAYKEQIAYKLGMTAQQKSANAELKATIEAHNAEMLAAAKANFNEAIYMSAQYDKFKPATIEGGAE